MSATDSLIAKVGVVGAVVSTSSGEVVVVVGGGERVDVALAVAGDGVAGAGDAGGAAVAGGGADAGAGGCLRVGAGDGVCSGCEAAAGVGVVGLGDRDGGRAREGRHRDRATR